MRLYLLAVLLGIWGALSAQNTITLTTFDRETHNWATAHRDTFILPGASDLPNRLYLTYKLDCPAGGCDPWDRLGHLRVLHKGAWVELVRNITPYNKACEWTTDVTELAFLLQDSVIMESYIETWIGGTRGWDLTVNLTYDYDATPPAYEGYAIERLWRGKYEYGNPDVPIDSTLAPVRVPIDTTADSIAVRVFTTGHGQGNTENGAEFHQKTHYLYADNQLYPHTPWRSDCNANPCSPQDGTWTFSRAGWCPGDMAAPFEQDITSVAKAAGTDSLTLRYRAGSYQNNCRPGVSPCPCTDCNYNTTGHTKPILASEGQLIYYRKRATVALDETTPRVLSFDIAPNPSSGTFTWQVTSIGSIPCQISLVNAQGQTVWEAAAISGQRQEVQLPATLPRGVYLARVQTPSGLLSKRLWVQ